MSVDDACGGPRAQVNRMCCGCNACRASGSAPSYLRTTAPETSPVWTTLAHSNPPFLMHTLTILAMRVQPSNPAPLPPSPPSIAPALPQLGEEIVVGNNIGESVLEPTEEIFELQPNPPPAQGMHGESAAPRRFLSDQLRANNSEAGSGTGAGTAAGSIAAQSATTAGSHAHFVAMAGMAQREGSSSTRSVRPGVAGSMGPGVAIDRAMSHAFLGRAVTRKTLLFRGLRLKVSGAPLFWPPLLWSVPHSLP